MGRYYNGDIEGKFWFGVQSSNDADFFGQRGKPINFYQGDPCFLDYSFKKKDKSKVHEGLVQIEKSLWKYKKLLDEFFEGREAYNNMQLVKFLNKKEPHHRHTEEDVMGYLKLYARHQLGKEIYDCLIEKGSCNFEAEI